MPERVVLEVLFPKVRAEILRLLFKTPQKARYVRELTQMSGLTLCTVQDELRKLKAVGLVASFRFQRRHYYRANQEHSFFAELVRMVDQSGRLPRITDSALERPRYYLGKPRRKRPKARRLPDDAIQWNLFAQPKN